jgi:hypothetical protein
MIEKARFPPSGGSAWQHGILVQIRMPFDKDKK